MDEGGAGELRYDERAPSGVLADVVESIWYLRASSPERYEKILPLPAVHLVVNLGETYTVLRRGDRGEALVVDGPFMVGVQPAYVINENPAELHHVGARLRPERVLALAREHVGQEIVAAERVLPGVQALVAEVRDALGREAMGPDPAKSETTEASDMRGEHDHRGTSEALGETTAARGFGRPAATVLDAVESHLAAMVRTEYSPDPLVDRALALMRERPGQPVSDIAAAVGVSHKTLIAHINRECGVTPKRLADVMRMHRFVSEIPSSPSLPTWTELAARAGYYDQPHFIRSFSRMVGSTPREYLEQQRRFERWAPSFVPLSDAP